MRDWVYKFESGEYLRKWRGYSPDLLGIYSYDDRIEGEERFQHCIGEFHGIGDVSWWITAEVEALSEDDQDCLEAILKEKSEWIDKKPKISRVLSESIGIESFHIRRLPTIKLKSVLDQTISIYEKVFESGTNKACLYPVTLSANERLNQLRDFRDGN